MRFWKKLKRMLRKSFVQALMEEMACYLAYVVFRGGDPDRTLRRLLMVHHSIVENDPKLRFTWRKDARDALMYVLAYSGELDEQDMTALVEERKSKAEFDAFWDALHLKVQAEFLSDFFAEQDEDNEEESEEESDLNEPPATDDRAP